MIPESTPRRTPATDNAGSNMKRPLPDISDQKLVVLLKRDDLKSYEALFHRYYDLFLTFTKRVVRGGEHAAAEDIVQEVFMQLWLGRDRLDEHRSLYNLLFTMTKHRIYDHFRRRYNLEALRRPLSEFDAVSDEAESPESGLEAEQLRQTIARTVAAMPPQRRTIFALSRQENLSRQEIARRLGVSVRTVDKHLELALREIRLRIKDFQWVLLLFLFR